MNELPRLSEETENSLERALLDSGRCYYSSSEARAKTLTALGIGGAAVFSAGTATASLAPAAKVAWMKIVAVSLSVVGAATAVPVGYYAWQRSHEAPASVSTSASVPGLAAAAGVVAVAAPRDDAPGMAPIPAVVAREPVGAAQAPKGDSRASSVAPPLAAEIVAIDAARSALASGDGRGALSLLDEYARAYPHGRLELEGEALRIDALAKSGQKDAAKKRAEAFLRRHPKSVLGSRVRGYLDD